MAESFGIIALCQTNHIRRKYSVMILREVKNIAIASKCLQVNQSRYSCSSKFFVIYFYFSLIKLV